MRPTTHGTEGRHRVTPISPNRKRNLTASFVLGHRTGQPAGKHDSGQSSSRKTPITESINTARGCCRLVEVLKTAFTTQNWRYVAR
jgi:hypothetical protein